MSLILSDQWRIYISANNGSSSFTGLIEVEMSDEPSGSNIATGGTASASSQLNGYEASKAFNGIKTGGDGWTTSTNQESPCWIAYTFSEPVNIREVRLYALKDSTAGADAQPRDFTIEYHDGSEWVSVNEYTGETGWSQYEERVYEGAPLPPHHITGKVTRGTINTPCEAFVTVHDQNTGEIYGSGYSDPLTGEYDIGVSSATTVFLKISDPSGKYNPVVVENIVPTPVV